MKKINEFINNDENLITKFNKLNRELYYETAHLSNLQEIMSSNSYKEILSHGDTFLPFIVDLILNDNAIFAHPLIFDEIVGKISDEDSKYTKDFKDILKDWWLENKEK
jgi:hypothetical protein